jgi:GNAT superfamily N-acetyltransferase
MRVEPATVDDLAAVRAVYAEARATQRERRVVVWPEFTDAAILAEVATGELYRVVDGNAFVGVFSVVYEDAAIWGEQERGAHVYLHRIARVAAYGGGALLEAVLAWAHARCLALGRDGLRMDTWAENAMLLAYYARFGFRVVGRTRVEPNAPLPAHYQGIELALLEAPCRVPNVV